MFEDITEYQLLVRCLSEQTVTEDGKRRLKKKEEGMGSGLMQNPSDPEATYREKAGKGHRGYSGFRQLAGPKGYVYSGPFGLTIIKYLNNQLPTPSPMACWCSFFIASGSKPASFNH